MLLNNKFINKKKYKSFLNIRIKFFMEYSQMVRHTFLVRCIESSNLSIPELKLGLGGFEPPTSRLSGVHSNH